jgi:hypothetical protein
VHELSGCGDFLSALELAQCAEDSSLVATLHTAYGDDMLRKVEAFDSLLTVLLKYITLF